MNASKIHRIAKAKQKLAAGILLQARRDLRRFRDTRRAAERELYLDAYTWVIADNQRWPFSFRNVCKLLHLAPDELRQDLLHEVSLNACRYWTRRSVRLLRQFQTSLRQMFIDERSHDGAEIATLVHGLP
jgi:hypothetical protein